MAVLLIFLTAGCLADDPCADLPEAAVEMTLSRGTTLEPGSQGGFHVWLQVRAQGVCRDRATFDVEVRALDSGELVTPVAHVPSIMLPAKGGADPWRMPTGDLRVQICPTLEADALHRDLSVALTVGDEAGNQAFVESVVELACPDDHPDLRKTCERICSR